MIIPENNHYLQKYNCIGECIKKKVQYNNCNYCTRNYDIFLNSLFFVSNKIYLVCNFFKLKFKKK